MTHNDSNEGTRDIFVSSSIYPDAASVFTWRPQPFDSIKSECIVVLDTNVLLVPYGIASKSLDEIKSTYRMLVHDNRLVVPGQVAREFAKQRTTKLADLYNSLSNKKSQAKKLRKGKYPLLEDFNVYQDALELEQRIDDLIDEYQQVLGRVMDRVRDWQWDDPLSQLYGELFDERVVLDPEFDKDEVKRDLAWRQAHSVPPGYKDAGKDDEGVGDVLIWHTILKLGEERRKSVVFVSGEEKADWWHQSSGGPIYPRYELLYEYRRHSGGESFYIVNLSNLLELYGVDEAVVEEVRREEAEEVRREQTAPIVDEQTKLQIYSAICSEWENTDGQLHSRVVFERLRREGQMPPAYAMWETLKELKAGHLIRGPFMIGRDAIAQHGNMIIKDVDDTLCVIVEHGL